MMAIFSVCTPLGIGAGMLLLDTNDLTEVVFNCLAAGTFVYIACTEVIVIEFGKPESRYWKLLAFLIGVSIISVLLFIPQD